MQVNKVERYKTEKIKIRKVRNTGFVLVLKDIIFSKDIQKRNAPLQYTTRTSIV